MVTVSPRLALVLSIETLPFDAADAETVLVVLPEEDEEPPPEDEPPPELLVCFT